MTSTEGTQNLMDRFSREYKYLCVDELLTERRVLREIKSLYAKHAFDCLGPTLKDIYNNQYDLVQRLAKEYNERYGN
jgi:tRNA A-37 threonylcarbamoyl transferase component Bud32